MSQLTIPGIPKPPRPTINDEMIRAGVEAFFTKHPSMSVEVGAQSIIDVYSHPMDGYELSKELNSRGCDIDRGDMETLDKVEHYVGLEFKAAEKQWAADHDIQPPYPIGAHVHCKWDKKTSGVIASITEHSVATYLIKEDGCQESNRHLCVKFEDVLGLVESEEGTPCAS